MANRRVYQLSHCTYVCQYHLVWTPKYRGKVLEDKYIKQKFKRISKLICEWKGFPIHAWHIGDEHIHLFITIPSSCQALSSAMIRFQLSRMESVIYFVKP